MPRAADPILIPVSGRNLNKRSVSSKNKLLILRLGHLSERGEMGLTLGGEGGGSRRAANLSKAARATYRVLG